MTRLEYPLNWHAARIQLAIDPKIIVESDHNERYSWPLDEVMKICRQGVADYRVSTVDECDIYPESRRFRVV